MPARAKRIRYTFADTSFRHARTTQQPVHAWKKVWATPAHTSEEGAYTTPYKLFKWAKTGQTVVHEDEDEEITNSLASQLPSGVADPVPAPEEGEEHVPPSVLVSAAGEDSAHNTDQGANPPPADNVDNSSATQDNGAVSAESAVEAAAAAVEDVAAATYSAHAIGNLIAAAELDSPIPGREDMSVDGDNSAPATPSAGAVVDSTHATIPLAEALLPHAADDDGAANSFNDNQTTNPDEQMQS